MKLALYIIFTMFCNVAVHAIYTSMRNGYIGFADENCDSFFICAEVIEQSMDMPVGDAGVSFTHENAYNCRRDDGKWYRMKKLSNTQLFFITYSRTFGDCGSKGKVHVNKDTHIWLDYYGKHDSLDDDEIPAMRVAPRNYHLNVFKKRNGMCLTTLGWSKC